MQASTILLDNTNLIPPLKGSKTNANDALHPQAACQPIPYAVVCMSGGAGDEGPRSQQDAMDLGIDSQSGRSWGQESHVTSELTSWIDGIDFRMAAFEQRADPAPNNSTSSLNEMVDGSQMEPSSPG